MMFRRSESAGLTRWDAKQREEEILMEQRQAQAAAAASHPPSSTADGGRAARASVSSSASSWRPVRFNVFGIFTRRRGGSNASASGLSSFVSLKFRRGSSARQPPSDPWERKQRLMVVHKTRTKEGRTCDVFFGTESLSIDSKSLPYMDVLCWTYTSKAFKLTYLTDGGAARHDCVLYACEGGPRPVELYEMISMRVAQLCEKCTGCSEQEARELATQPASESEIKQIIDMIDVKENPLKEESMYDEAATGDEGPAPEPLNPPSDYAPAAPPTAASLLIAPT